MKKLLLLLSIVCIGQIHGQIITTIAGSGTSAGYSGDGGQATSALLNTPYYLTFDASGNLYFSDMENHRIRKINASGVITTIAGTGTIGFSGDGGPATSAQLNYPLGLKFDNSGNLFFCDCLNYRIRKIDTAGIITTVAGTGTPGYTGNGGPALSANINNPICITFDNLGNFYFSEESKGTIRKVSTSGIITSIAGTGTGGFSGDNGPATLAQLSDPGDIAFDVSGNLLIADESNNRVRKINTSGIISTIVGNGTQGYSGDGGLAISAELSIPAGIVLDAIGNIYISDDWNKVVRKVNTSGIITTIVGNGFGAGSDCSLGSGGFSGDGGLATLAELRGPGGLVFDSFGNLYFADLCNNRIRMVTNVDGIDQIEWSAQVKISPNPTSDQFFIQTNTTDKLTVDLYDVNGRHVFSASVSDKSNINVTTLNEGAYTITIKTVNYVINKKLVIVR